MFSSNAMRLAMALGAVALAAALGFGLWQNQVLPGPGVDPSPTPSAATPTITPPTPGAETPDAPATPGSMQEGTWSFGGPDDELSFFVNVSFEVPPGWVRDYRLPEDDSAGVWSRFPNAMLIFADGVRPFEDPCARPLVPMAVGPTADDLAHALAQLPLEIPEVASDAQGNPVPDPATSRTEVDGYPAWQLTFTSPGSREGCQEGVYDLWRWNNGFNHGVGPGGETRVWVVDVEGTRLLIAMVDDDATDDERRQLQQTFESIQLGPAASP